MRVSNGTPPDINMTDKGQALPVNCQLLGKKYPEASSMMSAHYYCLGIFRRRPVMVQYLGTTLLEYVHGILNKSSYSQSTHGSGSPGRSRVVSMRGRSASWIHA
jgi:hypothetical protein